MQMYGEGESCFLYASLYGSMEHAGAWGPSTFLVPDVKKKVKQNEQGR